MHIYNLANKQEERLLHTKSDLLLITCLEKAPHTLSELLEDEKNLHSPLLITNAVANLCPFSEITLKHIEPNTEQNTREFFGEGMAFGRSYELRGSALILGQISKAITSNATEMLTLLQNRDDRSLFEQLHSCDATLLFCAGFLLEASRRFHIIIGGGLEMLAVLFLADLLREELLMRPMSRNITLITSQHSEQTQAIKEILEQLSYRAHLLCTIFELHNTEIEELKEIEKNLHNGSAASSAAIAYAEANGISNRAIVNEMELIVYLR